MRRRRFVSGAFLVFASFFMVWEVAHPYNGGNGSISVEVKNPDQFYAQVSQLVKKYKVTMTSYNSYTHPQTKKVQISSQFQCDEALANDLLDELVALAPKVTGRNYSASPPISNLAPIEEQIKALGKELELLGSLLGKVPIIVGLITQHRQSLLSQKAQAAAAQKVTTVNLSLNIQEEGYSQPVNPPIPQTPPPGSAKRQIPISWVIAGGVFIACFLALGLLLRKRKSSS